MNDYDCKPLWERELDTEFKQILDDKNDTSDNCDIYNLHVEDYENNFTDVQTTSDSDLSCSSSRSSFISSVIEEEGNYFQERLKVFQINSPSKEMIDVIQKERQVYDDMCLLIDKTCQLTVSMLTTTASADKNYSQDITGLDTKEQRNLPFHNYIQSQDSIILLQLQLIEKEEENKKLKEEVTQLFHRLNNTDRLRNAELVEELIKTKVLLALALTEIDEEKMHRFKIIRALSRLK